jgi:hypothetical protein
VHKDTIAVALAAAGLRGEVREHGKIPNTPTALKALTMKLASARRELRFCYEAGPCCYGIQRQLTEAGHECAVVAPSLIPRKPGARGEVGRQTRLTAASDNSASRKLSCPRSLRLCAMRGRSPGAGPARQGCSLGVARKLPTGVLSI